MNATLLNNRPTDSDKEEFKKVWNNSGYALEALYKTIQQYKAENSKIKKEDFNMPNHYAKLAYEAGFIAALDQIAALLPETAKP